MEEKKISQEEIGKALVYIAKAIEACSDSGMYIGDYDQISELLFNAMDKTKLYLTPTNLENFHAWLAKQADRKMKELIAAGLI